MSADAPLLGVFTTDTHLIVRTWDPGLASLTGIPAEQAAGRLLRDIIPDLQARDLLSRFEQVLASGFVEVLTPAFHGCLIPCPPRQPSRYFDTMRQRATIAPLRDGPTIVGLIVTVEDMTARLEHERELAARLQSDDPSIREAAQRAMAIEADVDVRALESLRDSDWRVRRAAARSLGLEGDRVVVASVLTMLRRDHRDFGVLSSALQVLSMSNIDIVGPLIELLDDEDADLRIQAALLLGRQRDARVTRALIRTLEDPDINVRFHAIEALGHLHAAEAVDGLVRIATSTDFFLAFPALDALVQIGERRVAPSLVPLLADAVLRTTAAEALGQLGDDQVVRPLVRLLDRPGAPVEIIAEALARLHRRYEDEFGEASHIAGEVAAGISPSGTQKLLDALAEVGPDALPSLARVLGWLDTPAVQKAMTLLLGHPGARAEVIKALVRYGAGVVSLLVDQLTAGDPDARHAAVVALGRIGDRRATAPLVETMRRDPELLVPAATALARIGDAAAFEALLSFLGHEESVVRHAVVSALHSIGHPDMAQRVVRLLADSNPHVRESAVRIAGYFGYAECVPGLLACSHDPDEDVRRVALESLPFLDDGRAIDVLAAALRDDTPRARAGAAQAVAQMDSPGAAPLLVQALGDTDSWVRFFAARGIGRRRQQEAIPMLIDAARRDPAYHVRLACIEALGRTATDDSVRVLAEIAAAGEEDLAQGALRACGTSSHPAARPVLESALRGEDAARRAVAAAAIATHGGPGAAQLLQWAAVADEDARVWQTAIEGLATLAGQQSAESPAAIDALVAISVDSTRRDAAIRALACVPSSQIDRVASGLRSPRSDARCAVVAALGRIRHPRASAWLVKALGDAEASVRGAAVAALAQLGSRGVEREIAALASTDPDPSVRLAATAALRRDGPNDRDWFEQRSDAGQGPDAG